MKNISKISASVLSAAVCLGCAAPARAFWPAGGEGGGALEQLGLSAGADLNSPQNMAESGGSFAPVPVPANGADPAASAQPGYPFKADNSKNTVMDRVHAGYNRLKEKIYGPGEKLKTNYTTQEAADITLGLIAAKLAGGRNFRKNDVPAFFKISSNNASRQYQRGNAFSKLKELIEKATAAKKSGLASGVFIVAHNFILSGEETALKMSDLLINAKAAGVPVLLSYDQFGTHVYASGALPVIKRMKDAGIGLLTNASLMGNRIDHRKLYFIGAGDGHVYSLAGGQGWCVQYSGKDWDKLPALADDEGGRQNGADEEMWMDHMRMIDGEAALQGVLHFIGLFASQAEPDIMAAGLNLGPEIKAGSARVKQALESIFMPALVKAGNQQAAILTNIDWANRPVTDVWYDNLSDPDVTKIRIAMPYITDPVFRTKLKQAVKDGKDIMILIPGISDNLLSQKATKYHFCDLLDLHEKLIRKGGKAGKLELREWQDEAGKPVMLHMKYGIFIRKTDSSQDTVIDGSYNATAVEARSGELNANIMLKGKESARQAADEFDELFETAKKFKPSLTDKAGLPVMIVLRPFM